MKGKFKKKTHLITAVLLKSSVFNRKPYYFFAFFILFIYFFLLPILYKQFLRIARMSFHNIFRFYY